jgi:hypothetical protein
MPTNYFPSLDERQGLVRIGIGGGNRIWGNGKEWGNGIDLDRGMDSTFVLPRPLTRV